MNSILEEYDKKKNVLESLDRSLDTLINSLLKQKNIKSHQIQTRVKDRDSLEKKIIAKQKYKTLDDITDVVGIRIITYFEDDVNKVAKVVEEEFDIDQDNSVDKREIDSDRFGYRSLHYVASLKENRMILSEYSDYGNFKFEFQIRSILQHSWAEIEHDIGYKGASEIPSSAKRTFYRVAALLEQADIEFVKLKSTISEYEESLNYNIKVNPSKIEINKASLISFMSKNEHVINFENNLFNYDNDLIVKEQDIENFVDNKLIKKIKTLGIENIEQLEEAYLKNEQLLVERIESILPEKVSSIVRGVSVFILIKFVLLEDYN